MRYNTKELVAFSGRNTWKSLLIMLVACAICVAFRPISASDYHVPLIFVLAVMLISRLTEGYFYGVASSLFSVFCVNYVFTYPFMAFNFSMSGYPLTL